MIAEIQFFSSRELQLMVHSVRAPSVLHHTPGYGPVCVHQLGPGDFAGAFFAAEDATG
jgi:hypothetical protein